MTKLTISEATAADLDGLCELYGHLNPDDELCPSDKAPFILQKIRRYDGSSVLIGKIEDLAVASCTLIVIPNLTRLGRPYALIENVVTHSQWRKRGFGAALLKAATDRAWDHDCYKVMLMTGSKEPGTLSFYDKIGFEQSKTGFQIRQIPPRT